MKENNNQESVQSGELFSIVLVEPQIPPNTGNIARLAAALEIPLYLVGQVGFKLSDKHARRAGLDYWKYADVRVRPNIEEFFSGLSAEKIHFFSKFAEKNYTDSSYSRGDYLVFGSEISGLPEWIFEKYQDRLVSLPIFQKKVRSLNLSSAAAAGAYEALRQINPSGNPG
jgi:tRNA (cytidine/uridine-2'-O-)-methyltransferase